MYSEGLAFVERIPDSQRASVAFDYVAQQARVETLVASVRASNLPDAQEIADLLEKGGVRSALLKPKL